MKFLTFFLILIISACSTAPKKRTDKLSILQGLTSSKEVEFSILALADKKLEFELRSADGEIIKPDETKIVSRPHSPWVIHKIIFSRDQKKDFNLYAFENQKLIDQRLIGKGQLDDSKLKLAVLSCINDGYEKHFKIWDQLALKNPEYVLMIGDNVYANREANGGSLSSNPETLWRRYTDIRLTIPFYFQEKLIPTHAIWDDNDYGPRDSGKHYEYKNEAKDIFETFWAQSLSDDSFIKGLGVGGQLELGDFNLYFLDARTFRDEKGDGEHLGKDQYQWLMKSLKEEAQPSLLIKGDQFFGGYHEYDSFEGQHSKNFDQFIKDLRLTGTPMIFISGDRHMSEIMQFPRSLLGLPSFEITSSPMHSRVFEDNGVKNPWRVVHTTAKMNFTLIENIAQDNHWFMDVQNIGENGEMFFHRELAVFIKDLQNNLNEVRKRRHGKRRYRRIRRGRR